MIPTTRLRLRAGLNATDASQDAELNRVLGIAVALVEQYLDRTLAHGTEIEKFTHVDGASISLRRYPLESITSINPAREYHAENRTGLLHFDGAIREHEIEVRYTGGYSQADLPADLALAIEHVFGDLWTIKDGGAASSSGVKTVRAGDLSVTYATGGAAGQGGGGSYGGTFSPMVAAILDLYVREKA